MNILWDEAKNSKLKKERHISFEEITALLLEHKFLDILEHPKRINQKIFILPINNYIYAVPFVIDEEDNIILKTAFPSRKFHKKYKAANNESKT